MNYSQTVLNSINQTQLTQTVFSIIDSRIQFLEYQINLQFDFQKQKSDNHLAAYEQLMDFYAEGSTALKLLQILKEWVREENAHLIFDLLQEDAYLKYSEQTLERVVQFREFDFA